eukprot:JP435887.1.p1 GENE.JP435887.1~~JP435887.1.p1  ORF type:complete len:315 (+),score=59.64 JP435887.1:1-945(+)
MGKVVILYMRVLECVLFLLCALGTAGLPFAVNNTLSLGGGVERPMLALEMARASYCYPEKVADWSCDVCNTKGFKVTYQSPANKFDTVVFVGWIENQIVISFRGSRSIKNWIENLHLIKVDTVHELCSTCKVHGGFKESYDIVKDDIVNAVFALKTEKPNADILVTGHSLGGAEATLCAVDLTFHHNLSVNIITFGSPRVGNNVFAQFFQDLMPHHQRWVNKGDIVPHLPPTKPPFSLLGFHHVGTEYWISSAGDMVCDGSGEDVSCSNSLTTLSYNIHNHLFYMSMPIGWCNLLFTVPEWTTQQKEEVWPHWE